MNDTPIENMTDEECAAELLALHLDNVLVVNEVGLDSAKVCFTTDDEGVHLGNVYEDYDFDVHLVCEFHNDTIQSGPLAGTETEATVYVNGIVNGIRGDATGVAIPLYRSGKAGPVRKKDVTVRVLELCERLNVHDLHE